MALRLLSFKECRLIPLGSPFLKIRIFKFLLLITHFGQTTALDQFTLTPQITLRLHHTSRYGFILKISHDRRALSGFFDKFGHNFLGVRFLLVFKLFCGVEFIFFNLSSSHHFICELFLEKDLFLLAQSLSVFMIGYQVTLFVFPEWIIVGHRKNILVCFLIDLKFDGLVDYQ